MSEKVSALDEIRWAKENLDAKGKKGAPSTFAVQIRDRMLESKEFFDKFVFSFYPKLLPRNAGEEDTDKSRLDGQGVVDVIDRITALRDKSLVYPEKSE